MLLPKKIRLQKYLSQTGFCSRRQAEKLINEGRICVDGTIAKIGQKVLGQEEITADKQKIFAEKFSLPQKKIILFHKPLGVESSMRKFKNHHSLANFDFGKNRVFPVGRLDKNSRGLMILTNDGDLALRLSHPRYNHEKEYQVQVNRDVTDLDMQKLSQGKIILDSKKVRKCKVQKIGQRRFTIVLREGKKRQIRLMCKVLGLIVQDLCRTRIGKYLLKDLPAGEMIQIAVS